MSSGITLYTPPATIRSTLLKNPTDTIPSTEELEALQAELKQLRQRTLERAKKAGDDLKTIEESMRRLKEREKGKGKAVDKIKKERACTCSLSIPYFIFLTICVISLRCHSTFRLCEQYTIFCRWCIPPGSANISFYLFYCTTRMD